MSDPECHGSRHGNQHQQVDVLATSVSRSYMLSKHGRGWVWWRSVPGILGRPEPVLRLLHSQITVHQR